MTKEQKEFRDKLFPNGEPTPEEFIRVMAEAVREEMVRKQKNKQ